jgi:proteasome lid subunit RPN8/RPN11
MAAELRITPEALAEIVAHAREALPDEACGYLGERDGAVGRVVRMTNAEKSPTRFSLLPEEQFAAVRLLRAEGVSLRGVYHSHPDGPARLSAEDRRLAFDESLSYVVVSLAGDPPAVRSFRIGAPAGEEAIVTVSIGGRAAL